MLMDQGLSGAIDLNESEL